jgi:hypothetical protein
MATVSTLRDEAPAVWLSDGRHVVGQNNYGTGGLAALSPAFIRKLSSDSWSALEEAWREGGDSNPRRDLTPLTRLAGGRFRPLSHLPRPRPV